MNQIVSSRKILVNVATLLSGSVIARGFAAATIVLTARWLGPDPFGQYAASLALTRILAVFFGLGLEGWLLQSGGKDNKLLGSKASAGLFIQSGLGIVWLLVLLLISPYLNQDIFPTAIFIPCAISVYFETLLVTATNGFKAALKNNITFGLLIGTQGFLLMLTILFIVDEVQSVEFFVFIRVLASLVGAIVAITLLLHRFGFSLARPTILQAMRETPAFGVSRGLSSIIQQADLIIVALFLGKTSAGLYAPAVTVASTINLAPQAIFSVMVPIIGQTLKRSKQLVKTLSKRLLSVMAVFGLGAGLLLIVLAKPLIHLLYGPEFAVTGGILMILGGVLLFRFTTFGAGAILVGIGWQSRRVIIQATVAIFNIVLNILIIEQGGLRGVAVVYVISEALLTAGYLLYVRAWMRKIPDEILAVPVEQ